MSVERQGRRWFPHAWIVLALVLGGLSMLVCQIVGELGDLDGPGSTTDATMYFGWPAHFLGKPLDSGEWVENNLSDTPWFIFNRDAIDWFDPWMLLVDVAVATVLLAGAVYWIERLCRHHSIPSQFRVASILALMGWVATVIALEANQHSMHSLVWVSIQSLWMIRIALIGAFWMGAVDFAIVGAGWFFRDSATSDTPISST